MALPSFFLVLLLSFGAAAWDTAWGCGTVPAKHSAPPFALVRASSWRACFTCRVCFNVNLGESSASFATATRGLKIGLPSLPEGALHRLQLLFKGPPVHVPCISSGSMEGPTTAQTTPNMALVWPYILCAYMALRPLETSSKQPLTGGQGAAC